MLFLDEPTTGLDLRGRNEVWDTVRSLVAGGTTVPLTTQYLEEADQLAGQIVVIGMGRVIADGALEELKSRIGGDRIDVVVRSTDELARTAVIVGRACKVEPETDPSRHRISAPVGDRVSALTEVVLALGETGVAAEDIELRRPTLDDVFLRLTGHPATTKEAEEAA